MIEKYLPQSIVNPLKLINAYDRLDALVQFISIKYKVLNVFVWFDQYGKIFLIEIDIKCDKNIDKLKKEINKQYKDLYNLIYIWCI